jgi:phage-related protein (TIGR01555 family)
MEQKAKGLRLAKIYDGWVNIMTGLGLASKDKRVSAQTKWDIPIEVDCENLYASDDVAARLVDTLPDDAFREGIKLNCDPELATKIEKEFERIGAWQKLHLGWVFGRIYGGAGVVMIVDDSKTLDQPMDLNSIRKINGLVVLQRFELQADVTNIDNDVTSPNFGMPKTYTLVPRRGGTTSTFDPKSETQIANISNQKIHYSRIIRFDGNKLPIRNFIQNSYWHDSVFTRTGNAIRNYNTVHDAVATVLQEFNQGVFKIKGLSELLAQGTDGDTAVQNRLSAVNIGRSVARSVIIDSDGEEFTNIAANVSGVPDMVRLVGNRLTVASNMPHTKILGESASGLGATGQSEQGDWYDYVSNQQEKYLRPRIQVLLDVIYAQRLGPTNGKPPEKAGWKFLPLEQMSEKEQAEIRKMQAETDNIYLTTGVVDPTEIATSRFGGEEYSTETHIVLEDRKPDPVPTPTVTTTPNPAAVPPATKV